MFASQHGDLGAVLRKHDDVETMKSEDLTRLTFQEVEKLVGNLDAQREHRIIEVRKGGKIEEISVRDTAAE